jgi:hypothetical protein
MRCGSARQPRHIVIQTEPWPGIMKNSTGRCSTRLPPSRRAAVKASSDKQSRLPVKGSSEGRKFMRPSHLPLIAGREEIDFDDERKCEMRSSSAAFRIPHLIDTHFRTDAELRHDPARVTFRSDDHERRVSTKAKKISFVGSFYPIAINELQTCADVQARISPINVIGPKACRHDLVPCVAIGPPANETETLEVVLGSAAKIERHAKAEGKGRFDSHVVVRIQHGSNADADRRSAAGGKREKHCAKEKPAGSPRCVGIIERTCGLHHTPIPWMQ